MLPGASIAHLDGFIAFSAARVAVVEPVTGELASWWCVCTMEWLGEETAPFAGS